MFLKVLKSYLLAIFILGVFIRLSYAGLSEFDLSNNTIELQDFISGGPKKDGIPALTNPQFISAKQADFLGDNDPVVGISINGRARAYPLGILNWHEIVNDQISNIPVAVTWCPLTRSAITFDRRVKGDTLEFGVSGLLYNSNVVMYDRNYDGLWSQLKSGGLTGKFASQDLKVIPSQVTTWKNWREQHPETLILSRKTGYRRDYNNDPYKDYHSDSQVMFPVKDSDRRLPLKSLVVGLKIDRTAKAYPLDIINRLNGPLFDKVAGVAIKVESVKGGTILITDLEGNVLPSVVVYWFAWSTFHPDTLIFSPPTESHIRNIRGQRLVLQGREKLF